MKFLAFNAITILCLISSGYSQSDHNSLISTRTASDEHSGFRSTSHHRSLTTLSASTKWRITCGIANNECGSANAYHWIIRYVAFYSDTLCTDRLAYNKPIDSGLCCPGEGTHAYTAMDGDTDNKGWQANGNNANGGGGGFKNAWIGVEVSASKKVKCVTYRNGYNWGYSTDKVYLEAYDMDTNSWQVMNRGNRLAFTAGTDPYVTSGAAHIQKAEVEQPIGAGGGGDPHFFAFGDIFYTFQGHCDLVLVKTPKFRNGNKLEVHIRTTKVRKWSKISAIAIKVGADLGEISSHDGNLVLNGHVVDSVETESMQVIKSNLRKHILLYQFIFEKDKMLEVKVNTSMQMIYTTLSGNYPQGIVGILGSPHKPGLFKRDGTKMTENDVNAFVESWQQRRDADSQLFHGAREPQFPSKCLYDMGGNKSNAHSRRLKEVYTVSTEEATAACTFHGSGVFRNFCIEDVLSTGDIESAKDTFYNH